SETIAHIQEHLQDRARVAQTARNDFVQEKNGHSLSPADARRLPELEKYAAQTREDVYRGFETLDAQFRDLGLVRAQTAKQVQEIEVSHLDVVVQTDQQWHFDSLREVLNGEMSKLREESQDRADRALGFGLARLDSVYER